MSKVDNALIDSLTEAVAYLTKEKIILTETLARRQASLDELRKLNDSFSDTIDSALLDALAARDAAWLAEAKLRLYEEAVALPAYYTAPTACCKCGSQNLGGEYVARSEPNRIEKWDGCPEHIHHYCNDCSAPLGQTRTLEDSK